MASPPPNFRVLQILSYEEQCYVATLHGYTSVFASCFCMDKQESFMRGDQVCTNDFSIGSSSASRNCSLLEQHTKEL
ncbi:unnamed protein product [Urochloa humidicola]